MAGLVCCLLQILNEVNARRIKDELNVFEGIHRSPIFLAVLVITAGLQVWVITIRLLAVVKGVALSDWLNSSTCHAEAPALPLVTQLLCIP